MAHLVEVAQWYQRVITLGVQGEMGPLPEFVPPDTAPAAFIAQSAIEFRERLGEALLPTFRVEAETFVLVLYQRLPLPVAMATGSLAVEGDDELTAAFHRWLQGG